LRKKGGSPAISRGSTAHIVEERGEWGKKQFEKDARTFFRKEKRRGRTCLLEKDFVDRSRVPSCGRELKTGKDRKDVHREEGRPTSSGKLPSIPLRKERNGAYDPGQQRPSTQRHVIKRGKKGLTFMAD